MRRAAAVLAAALAGAALAAPPAGASGYIDIRVSFKLVRHPSSGTRPLSAQGQPVTDADLQSMLEVANDSLQAAYGRGYRFVLAEPPVPVGTTCTTCPDTNPSFWYSALVYGSGVNRMKEFEDDAKASVANYAWRTDAVNIYVNQGQGNGGVSSFPFLGAAHEIVVFGGTVVDATFREAFAGALVHHELGHWFDLKHTFDSQPACTDDTAAGCSGCPGGDDGIPDTLLDRACTGTAGYPLPGWEWLDIAQKNYGVAWLATPAQVAAVNRTYYNNMSYHNGGFGYGHMVLHEMSEGQLDHFADIANTARDAVRTGRTWFVQGGGGGGGTSTSPYPGVTQGIAAANAAGGDIVLLRPGTYTHAATLTKPLTLRATRTGPATIVNPAPLAQRAAP